MPDETSGVPFALIAQTLNEYWVAAVSDEIVCDVPVIEPSPTCVPVAQFAGAETPETYAIRYPEVLPPPLVQLRLICVSDVGVAVNPVTFGGAAYAVVTE